MKSQTKIKDYAPILKWAAPLGMIGGGVLSLLFFFDFLPQAGNGWERALIGIGGVLALLFAFCLAVFSVLHWRQDPNFFLYDRNTGKNRSLSDLGADDVEERMRFYLDSLTNDPSALWTTDLLVRHFAGGNDAAYLPLTVYQMMWDLTDEDDLGNMDAFAHADPDTVMFLAGILDKMGERELAELFRAMLSPELDPLEQINSCLAEGRNRFSSRMLAFVQRHIDAFY